MGNKILICKRKKRKKESAIDTMIESENFYPSLRSFFFFSNIIMFSHKIDLGFATMHNITGLFYIYINMHGCFSFLVS